MNEFGKKFEYFDDKKGALLYFIIMIITADVILSLICFIQAGALLGNPLLNVLYKAMGVLCFLLIPYTAVTCYRVKRNLVMISKVYLAVRTVYMTCGIVILFINSATDNNMIGTGKKYSSVAELVLYELLFPLGCIVISSGGWYLYLLKSKRCREITKG